MQDDASATGNDHNLSIASRFEDYIPNDISSMYPPVDPYREPARSSSMQYQDPMNLSVQCLTRLRDTTREVETLRLESETLRYVNQELHNPAADSEILPLYATAAGDDYNRSTVMKKASFEDASSFLNSFDSGGGDKAAEDEIPTSVMEPVTFPLPKSISVRSRGYLKMSQAPAAASSDASENRSLTRSSRIASPLNASYSGGHYFLAGSSSEMDRDYEILMRLVGEGDKLEVDLTRNWITEGTIVPNIRTQHGLTCRAYAVATVLEYLWKIKHPQNDQTAFSAQQLIDCCKPIDCWQHIELEVAYPYRTTDALAWVKKYGIVTRERYPDAEIMGQYRCSFEMRYFQNIEIVELPDMDQEQWIDILDKHPILACMWVDAEFYTLGADDIYFGPKHPTGAVCHAVVLMGLTKYNGYEVFLFQNSYGETWGSNGFGKIARYPRMTRVIEKDSYYTHIVFNVCYPDIP